MDETDPYQPPGAELTDPAPALDRPLASRWRRLFGDLIDMAFVGCGWIPLMFRLDWLTLYLSNEVPFRIEAGSTAIELGLFLLINSYFIQANGQTMGKVLMRTRVVDLQGKTPSWLCQVVLRYGPTYALTLIPVLGVVWFLADALFIFRRDRRRLADHLAGTKVVDV